MENPVTKRVAELQRQWARFGEDEAPCLLRWVVADPYDLPLVQTFFDIEDSEEAVFPDLFMKLESPFTGTGAYGRTLALELAGHYREMRPALIEAGVNTDWRPPARAPGSSDVGRLYDAAASFHAHHEPFFRRLVLFLAPEAVADVRGFRLWLEAAVLEHHHPEVRLVVLDDGRQPALEALAQAHAARVRSEPVALGFWRAIEEISDKAGGFQTPGGQFRHFFLLTSSAWAARNPDAAEKMAAQALAVAEQQSWQSLAATVHYLMGSGYLTLEDPVKAARRFQQAERVAEQAELQQEPGARSLRLSARMSLGTVLISQHAYARAAQLYLDTIPFAAEALAQQLHIECWRMAAYAYECDGKIAEAWQAALRALAVGEQLDEESRSATTLPFVGEALLRLVKATPFSGRRAEIDERLSTLLGPDWRTSAARRLPAPESAAS